MAEIEWNLVPAAPANLDESVWTMLAEARGTPPFLDANFLKPALTAFGSGREVIAVGSIQRRPVAACILTPTGLGRWATFQPSQLPLGAFVCERDLDWQLLVVGLFRALPGFVIELSFTQQDPQLRTRPSSGPNVACIDYLPTAWVDIEGNYESFWEGRGKNLRQNLRKNRRKLAETGKLELEVLNSADSIGTGLAAYAELESTSWKASGGTAIAVDNPQWRFYTAMLEQFAQRAQSMVLVLRLDAQPIAAILCIRGTDSIVMLKTTYDVKLSKLSPGQLLHEDAFEVFFAMPEIRRVEFFGKVMEWHTRWTDNQRMLYHASFYRWPVIKVARDAAVAMRARLRRTA